MTKTRLLILFFINMPRIEERCHSAVLVTLGCSKNRVDSERIGGALTSGGWVVRYDEEPTMDDVLILNTCGFIGDAKEESVGYILRAEEMLRRGLVRDVVVMGCLSERYGAELRRELPGVKHWFGVKDGRELLAVLGVPVASHLIDRLQSTPRHYAYLKIAEGCDRGCSFCAIPSIRGKYSSLSREQLIAETERLAEGGVKELMLVAQELTSYGRDLREEGGLAELLWKLSEVRGIEWLRLHYAYPTGFGGNVLEWMRSCSKACKYLDIPVQHISTPVLRSMNRQHDGAATRLLLAQLRDVVSEVTLRTSLIVGFPTEGQREFEELLAFVHEAQFDHLGVFAYSHEEGTSAAKKYEDVVPFEEKQRRVEAIMDVQHAIAAQRKRRFVGKTLRVIVDELLGNGEAQGRTEYDSPEVDGEVLVRGGDVDLQVGDILNVRIEGVEDYDLFGRALGSEKGESILGK